MVKLPENMPYIKTVQAKGREYLYFDTGQKDARGKRIYKRLPARSERRFGGVYAALLAHRTRRENVTSVATINDLSRLYQKHNAFTSTSEGTQATYLIYIKQIETLIGNAPVYKLERRDIEEIMERMQDRPGAATMLLTVLRNMLEIAVKKEWIAKSPADHVEPPEGDEDGDHAPWPEDLLAEALAARREIALPVALLYYTGQRIGDVCKMRWEDIQADGTIYVKQQKGGREVWPPIHSELAAMLADAPRVAPTILSGRNGAPRKKATLRGHLQAWAAERGHEVVPHGLRKNTVETLLEVGCSVGEIASITRQSLQVVEHYARRFNRRRLGKNAMSRWDGTDRQDRKPLENS